MRKFLSILMLVAFMVSIVTHVTAKPPSKPYCHDIVFCKAELSKSAIELNVIDSRENRYFDLNRFVFLGNFGIINHSQKNVNLSSIYKSRLLAAYYADVSEARLCRQNLNYSRLLANHILYSKYLYEYGLARSYRNNFSSSI